MSRATGMSRKASSGQRLTSVANNAQKTKNAAKPSNAGDGQKTARPNQRCVGSTGLPIAALKAVRGPNTYEELAASLRRTAKDGIEPRPVHERIQVLDVLIRRTRRLVDHEKAAQRSATHPDTLKALGKSRSRAEASLQALRTLRAEEVYSWLESELSRSSLLSEVATKIISLNLGDGEAEDLQADAQTTDLLAMILIAQGLPGVSQKQYVALKQKLIDESRALFVDDEELFNRDNAGNQHLVTFSNARAQKGQLVRSESEQSGAQGEAEAAAKAFALTHLDVRSGNVAVDGANIELARSLLRFTRKTLRPQAEELLETLAIACEKEGAQVVATGIRVKSLESLIKKICSKKFLENKEFLESEPERERGIADVHDLLATTIVVEDVGSMARAAHTVEALLWDAGMIDQKENKYFDDKAEGRLYEAIHYVFHLDDTHTVELHIKTRAAAEAGKAEHELDYKPENTGKVEPRPGHVLLDASDQEPLSSEGKQLLRSLRRRILARDLKNYLELPPIDLPSVPRIGGLDRLGWTASEVS